MENIGKDGKEKSLRKIEGISRNAGRKST